MYYYIDGYNMLFRLLHAGDDLRSQRQELIQDLQLKVNLLQLEVTLVFDSHYQPDEGSRSHLGALEIVFTPLGETADEYILQELKELRSPSDYTVVTSDKKLAWLCRRRLAKTESIDDFITWLNKRYKNRLSPPKIKPAPRESLAVVARVVPPPPAPKAEEPPKKQASAEDCFGYYLETFEKQVEEVAEKRVKKVELRSAGRSKKPKPKAIPLDPTEAYLSDLERWQRAFDKSDHKEDKF